MGVSGTKSFLHSCRRSSRDGYIIVCCGVQEESGESYADIDCMIKVGLMHLKLKMQPLSKHQRKNPSQCLDTLHYTSQILKKSASHSHSHSPLHLTSSTYLPPSPSTTILLPPNPLLNPPQTTLQPTIPPPPFPRQPRLHALPHAPQTFNAGHLAARFPPRVGGRVEQDVE